MPGLTSDDLSVVDARDPFAVLGVDVAPVGDLVSAVLVEVPQVGRALAPVGPTVPLVGRGLAFVRQPVAFVRDPFTLVGQPLPIVCVLLVARSLDEPTLGGALALGGRLLPMAGLDGSGCVAGRPLGIGQPAVIGGDHSLFGSPLLVAGDLLLDRSRLLGLFSHG
jgi:hypothetical protein